MRHGCRFVLLGALAVLIAGCGASASYPKLNLARSLYPGLGDLDAKQIPAAFATRVELRPPLTGGLVWLDDDRQRVAAVPLSEYSRAGVIDASTTALGRPPFTVVSTLPTTTTLEYGADGAPSLDTIRAAAAKFQYDVAFILQTGVNQSSGYNPFAIGYLGLVTAPLFPGTDVSAAAGAELCAVDVRSGIMLGCGVGQSRGEEGFLFPTTVSDHAETVRDRVVAEAVGDAAAQILSQIEARVVR